MRVSLRHSPPSSPLGRFGGGFQWRIGVQASALSRQRGTLIVDLLVFSVRVSWGTA